MISRVESQGKRALFLPVPPSDLFTKTREILMRAIRTSIYPGVYLMPFAHPTRADSPAGRP